jgi:integrase
MSVYKKKNRWYLDYYSPVVGRKREVVSIPGVDPSKITLRDAQKALAIRKAEIAEGKFNITKTEKKIPFTKLSERFLEYSKTNKKSYTRDITSIKFLDEYFGKKSLQQINTWQIEQYKSSRKKQFTRYGKPPSNATVNRELACLKTMFKKAIEWELTSNNPAKDVKLFRENNVNLRILSNGEFLKLYESSSELLKSFLMIAINTGMRPIEILNLKWEDVNFNQGYVLISSSKNNESRNIPMNDSLKKTLERLNRESNKEYIFSHKDGEPIKSVKKGFWSALRRSGINHCRIYDLRHTFASNLVMEGVDIVTVQELLGHKDITMTKRYSHPTPQHKKQAVSKLTVGNMDTYMDTSSDNDTNEANVSHRKH